MTGFRVQGDELPTLNVSSRIGRIMHGVCHGASKQKSHSDLSLLRSVSFAQSVGIRIPSPSVTQYNHMNRSTYKASAYNPTKGY
jgi:hypothetical protein